MGGGALLLALQLSHAVINDFETELVNTWRVIKENPTELLAILAGHKLNNSKDYYLKLREADRNGQLEKMTVVERAARFIYMNKVGFNGLWRVNKKGQNNVPFGDYKNPKVFDEENILAISNYLRRNNVQIENDDFEKIVEKAQTGDFVYFDPPYIPISETSSFTSYSGVFGLAEQERLRDVFVKLKARGVYVLISNSDVPLIDELYGEHARIERISVRRSIAANAKRRDNVSEVLIFSW